MKFVSGIAVVVTVLGLSTMTQAAMFETIAPSGLNAETQVGPAGFFASIADESRTYQIQFGASRLGDLTVGEQITALQWRLRPLVTGQTDWAPGDLIWSDYRITLAEAANPVTGMSTTFADNIVNPVLVRSGPLALHTSDFPSGQPMNSTNPNDWGPMITFDTPYTYAGGDLILFITHTGNGHAQRHLDGAHAGSDGWNTEYRGFMATGFESTEAVPVSGSNYNRVVVYTQFTVIPEPTSIALIGLGGLMLLKRRRG